MVCKLATEDGCVYTGRCYGAAGTRTGEIVFNTAMTGYQEILTDPSYCGQIVVMTFPLIGNYGVNREDVESSRLYLSGFAVKDPPRRPSNQRAVAGLEDYLREQGVVGIRDIDTRALTRRIRSQGAVRGAISTEVLDDVALVRMAAESESMVGANLAVRVESKEAHAWPLPAGPALPDQGRGNQGRGNQGRGNQSRGNQSRDREGAGQGAAPAPATAGSDRTCHLVAIDCGIKYNILRHLAAGGDRVTVVPGSLGAARIRELAPDGILVGNGPGDPAAVTDTVAALRELMGTVPIFGVCLGHQMLALALGAETYKLKFGHHGANVPVRNLPADRVEITSQNHGFAVDTASLDRCGGAVTHVNLNDGSLEGFAHADKQIAAVQFHPEANPGPHDSGHALRAFTRIVRDQLPLRPDTVFVP